MLNLSRCTIVFTRSENYLRLSLIIYFFALVMVCTSAFWLFFKLLFSLILLGQLLSIWHQPFPTSTYTHLDYFMNEWSLTHKNGQQFFYDRHRIMLDAGFFFLLELTEENHKKILVVFFDQLKKDDYRILKLVEKLR